MAFSGERSASVAGGILGSSFDGAFGAQDILCDLVHASEQLD